MATEKDDISIYHMDDGFSWGVYLQNILSADKYKIRCTCRAIGTGTIDSTECKVKLFLVSPAFLEDDNIRVFSEPSLASTDNLVCVLLGVEQNEFYTATKNAGIANDTWTILMAAEDPKVFREMLVTIIEVFETIHTDDVLSGDSFDLSSGGIAKRTSGASGDSSSNRESVDSVGSSDDPVYQVPPRARRVNRLHKVLTEAQGNSGDIYLLLDAESDVPLEVVRDDGLLLDTEVVYKAVYRVKAPAEDTDRQYKCLEVGTDTTTIADVLISKPSSMKRVEDILLSQVNPVSYMCTVFGIHESNYHELDKYLAAEYKRYWPPQMAHCFRFLDELILPDDGKPESKWPTVLHFAAEFKLESVTSTLLQIPGMVAACCTKNVNGEYPHDIATRTNSASIRTMIETSLENHKRRLDGHDSGFADKTICEDTPGNLYMPMDNLKEDTSVYTPAETHRSNSCVPTSPEPPDISTIPTPKEAIRSGKSRERSVSEGDSSGKKTRRSQSLKSSIASVLSSLKKRRPSLQLSLEKSLITSGKVYSRAPENAHANRERKKSSSSIVGGSTSQDSVPRDSGSFSEEETQEGVSRRTSASIDKKKHKRRKSVRIQRALKEAPLNLPCVPAVPVYSNEETLQF